MHVVVLGVLAEEADVSRALLVKSQQVLPRAVMAMEGAVAETALGCGTFGETAVASIALVLDQVLDGRLEIGVGLPLGIVLDVAVDFQALLVEVEGLGACWC